MNKTNAIVILIIIIISMALGYCIRYLLSDRNQTVETVTKIEYLQADTIKIYVSKPEPYIVETIRYVPRTYYIIDSISNRSVIDSAAIVRDFLTRKYYDQILLNDSTGYIRLEQIVAMNMIEDQKLTYNPPPTKIVTITRTIYADPRHKITPFFSLDYSWKGNDNDLSFGVGLDLTPKWGVQVGYSLQNYKSFGVTYTWR